MSDTSRVTLNGQRAFAAAVFVAAAGGWLGGSSQNPPQQQVVVIQGPAGQRGQPPPVIGTGFLAGQVVESPSGRGIAGATVALIGGGPMGRGGLPNQVVADSQGRFFFADLPAGAYRVQTFKAGYGAVSVNSIARTIDLADAEHITDVKVREVKLASLAGAVRDDGGDPVVGTSMVAFRRTLVNGRSTLRSFSGTRTDDRGTYRISNLPPGDYFVCACIRDPIPFDGLLLTTLAADPLQLMGVAARALTVGGEVAQLDPSLRTYAPTLFPSSLTVARATRVTLASGEDRTGVDIDVTATRSTRVSGSVTGAIGPLQASSMRLVPAGEGDDASTAVALSPMLVQADGRFDFAAVPPGQYVLRVLHTPTDGRGGGGPSGAALTFLGSRGSVLNQGGAMAGNPQLPNQPPLWAAEPVTVGDNGASGLAVALRPAQGLSGRVLFVGAADQPAPQALARLVIIPMPVAPDPGGLGFGNVGRLNPDATFAIPGVIPGRYSININSTTIPGWPTMKSVVVAGLDVTDLPIELGVSAVTDVVVTFGNAPMATLGGTVPGSPAGDVLVLVFPADRKYWADPGPASRRFRSSPVGRNGTFTVAGGLPAGEYFVVAVPDEDTNDWQEPTTLERLSKTAQRVTLADGDTKTIEVKR